MYNIKLDIPLTNFHPYKIELLYEIEKYYPIKECISMSGNYKIFNEIEKILILKSHEKLYALHEKMILQSNSKYDLTLECYLINDSCINNLLDNSKAKVFYFEPKNKTYLKYISDKPVKNSEITFDFDSIKIVIDDKTLQYKTSIYMPFPMINIEKGKIENNFKKEIEICK